MVCVCHVVTCVKDYLNLQNCCNGSTVWRAGAWRSTHPSTQLLALFLYGSFGSSNFKQLSCQLSWTCMSKTTSSMHTSKLKFIVLVCMYPKSYLYSSFALFCCLYSYYAKWYNWKTTTIHLTLANVTITQQGYKVVIQTQFIPYLGIFEYCKGLQIHAWHRMLLNTLRCSGNQGWMVGGQQAWRKDDDCAKKKYNYVKHHCFKSLLWAASSNCPSDW